VRLVMKNRHVHARLVLFVALLLVALAASPVAAAGIEDEMTLADRYAPIVRLVEQEQPCGHGEPYLPIDVDLLLGEATVGLRGPWRATDLVRVGPTADDLGAGLYEYHLDFPGNALDPGCAYERWADRLMGESAPTVYAHVVADAGYPGRIALQYWLFYAFNDFNNKHEGDWEMVQVVFDAGSAAEALSRPPVEVGYSQHEGAERASWDADKLELVDGTHPVVHSAAGSHANYFEEALYLGRTAEQGVGCDDTSSPTFDVRPVVRTIPGDPAAARREFPWIAYEGRWGELQEAFYNGPTGPNLKLQWTEPLRWVEEDWRDQSYAIPAGGVLGTAATDFFCGAVATGSDALRRAIDNPARALALLAALTVLLLFALTRTTWRPAAPLRAPRRRAWGQILAAAARMYVARWPLFVGIGLVFVPLAVLISALQLAVLEASDIASVSTDAESDGLAAFIAFAIGTTLSLTGLALVQAATAMAVAEIDAGRAIDPVRAFRVALARVPRLLGSMAVAVAVVTPLTLSVALVPIAVWLAGRWALAAQTVELEDESALGALRRSSDLVRGRWFKVASLSVVGAAIALLLGPLVGSLLILLTDAPFAVLNIVAALVYALAMPLVALTTTYLYYDAMVQERLEPRNVVGDLPSELGAPS
jgi:hypothetical protein